jgi:hypothetical protein
VVGFAVEVVVGGVPAEPPLPGLQIAQYTNNNLPKITIDECSFSSYRVIHIQPCTSGSQLCTVLMYANKYLQGVKKSVCSHLFVMIACVVVSTMFL